MGKATFLRFGCACALLGLAWTTPALAAGATADWVGHDLVFPRVHIYSGTFGDATNWSTGLVPGSADTAVFNAAQTYTVTFAANETNAALQVTDGSVTFAGNSTPVYTVGTASISSDLTLGGTSATALTLNDTGSLNVSGASLNVDAGSQLKMGDTSIGGSGLLTGTAGVLSVSGTGSSAIQSVGSTLTVGNAIRPASIQISSGGSYLSGSGAVAINALGSVNLTGGTFELLGNATVSGSIQGDSASTFTLLPGKTLTVQSGGRVDLGGQINLPAGTVVVDGSASHFNAGGALSLGSGLGGTTSFTYQNSATGALGGLTLGGSASSQTGTLSLQSGAHVTSGSASLGTSAASGTLSINNAIFDAARDVTLGSHGTLALGNGGAFSVAGRMTVQPGGTFQSDANSTLTLGQGSSLTVTSGATLNLSGNNQLRGTTITVNGGLTAGELAMGASASDSLSVQGGGSVTVSRLEVATTVNAPAVMSTVNVGASSILSIGYAAIGTSGVGGQAGALTVSGVEAALSISNAPDGSLGSLILGTTSGSTGSLTVSNDGTVSGGAIEVKPTGVLTVNSLGVRPSRLTVAGGAVHLGPSDIIDADITITSGTIDSQGYLRSPNLMISGAGSQVVGGSVETLLGTISDHATLDGVSFVAKPTPPGTQAIQVTSGAAIHAFSLTLETGPTGHGAIQLIGAGTSFTQVGAGGYVDDQGGIGVFQGATFTVHDAALFQVYGPTGLDPTENGIEFDGVVASDVPVTVYNATFQEYAGGSFMLAAGKTITFRNRAVANVAGTFTGGNVVNDSTFHQSAGTVSVQGFDGIGTLTVDAGAALTADEVRQHQAIILGHVAIRPEASPNGNSFVSSINLLSIMAAGQLDLSNNALQIPYAQNASPFGNIRAYLMSGYHGGAWDGPGIVTSLGDGTHGLGYADGADGVVANLVPGTILVEYARYGDTNLDGVVNFADLLALAQHYGSQYAVWDQGDMNYDGRVDFADLLTLAQNYGKPLAVAQPAQANPAIEAEVASTFVPVPEPVIGPIVLAALTLRRRRIQLFVQAEGTTVCGGIVPGWFRFVCGRAGPGRRAQ